MIIESARSVEGMDEETHIRTHWRRVLGKDGREEKRRKVDGSNKERGK